MSKEIERIKDELRYCIKDNGQKVTHELVESVIEALSQNQEPTDNASQKSVIDKAAMRERFEDWAIKNKDDSFPDFSKYAPNPDEYCGLRTQSAWLTWQHLYPQIQSLGEALTENRLCYYKVVEQRNEQAARIKELEHSLNKSERTIEQYKNMYEQALKEKE